MRVIPRSEWLPIAPNGKPGRMPLPAPRCWLHHGAAGTSSINTAINYARHHMVNRGWQDIGYSFVIAEGKVLEARGPGRIGAHTRGDNDASHGICIAGNYDREPPTDADLDALRWLLRHGAEQGWWMYPQLTGGHRDAPGASTACPGGELYRLISTINAEPTLVTAKDDDMPLTDDDLQRVRQVVRDELRQLIPANVEDEIDRLRIGVRALLAERTIQPIDVGDDGP